MINIEDNEKILHYYDNLDNPRPSIKIGRWNTELFKNSLLNKEELAKYMAETVEEKRTRLISIEGVIGSGKSELAQLLTKRYDGNYLPESVDDNPILEDYYADPKTNAFPLQIFFLNQRFKDLKETYKHPLNIQDRNILCDQLFYHVNYINGNATKVQYELYQDLLGNMMEEVHGYSKRPELLIFIDINLDTELKRITKRGRSYEQPDENNGLEDYYKQLHKAYQKFIKEYQEDGISPVLIINGDDIDFVENMEHRQKVLDMIDDKCLELGIISKETYDKVHGKLTK